MDSKADKVLEVFEGEHAIDEGVVSSKLSSRNRLMFEGMKRAFLKGAEDLLKEDLGDKAAEKTANRLKQYLNKI